MQRFLMASVLGLIAACGAAGGKQPATKAVAVTTVNDGDVVCDNEVSATTGMTHRVCHKLSPTSAETGEKDMICTDETPTGTNLTKRVCRSQIERDDDQKLARELYLNQSGRIGCNPELMGRCDGQPDLRPR